MIQATGTLEIENPYQGYAYAYPHKSAYRQLEPSIDLAEAWAGQRQDSLFLYFHIPFCEYRCGFCNLFTLAGGDAEHVDRYLAQVEREIAALRDVVPEARFARLAIGGGTPTYLEECELARLLDMIGGLLGSAAVMVPASCEASPATLTPGKARLLRQFGIERLSLGVQSFDDSEARTLGRPQRAEEVYRAVEVVRAAGFPALNLDLIYGGAGQSLAMWCRSVQAAVELRPEEIYLYPLYVRELTGLGRRGTLPGDDRLAAYRLGREKLLEAGYVQRSMRMFELPRTRQAAQPVYCCQSDGMVGLGCGARSYTRELHYSTEFAVGRSGVRAILADYLARDGDSFRRASHGFWLDAQEQRRRYVLQSLLQAEGLALDDYHARFSSELLTDLPQLPELLERELAVLEAKRLLLSPAGLELSDAIGPWLYSPRVQRLMEEFSCR